MNRPRQQFFAGPRFGMDQDRRIALYRPRRRVQNRQKRFRMADDADMPGIFKSDRTSEGGSLSIV